MRKALIGMFMAATAMSPAVLYAQEAGRERPSATTERFERVARENHQQRSDAAPSTASSDERLAQRREGGDRQRARGGGDRQRTQASQDRSGGERQRAQASQDRSGDWGDRQRRAAEPQRVEQARPAQHRAETRGSTVNQTWQGDRNDPRMERHRERYEQLERQNAQRYGNQRRDGQRDMRRDDRRDWSRDWRNDRRYDWQRYRYSNRNHYRMPPYYAPYRGHRYSRFSIGLFIGQPLFHQRYWISDPWHYRLPPAPYGYQWVRYYNDVLLVDTWSGRVVDVIYDFFW